MKKNIILFQLLLLVTILTSALFFAFSQSNESADAAASEVILRDEWQNNYNASGECKEIGTSQPSEDLLINFSIKEFVAERRWGIKVDLTSTSNLTNYVGNSNYKIGGYTIGSGLVFISNSNSTTITSENIVWAKNVNLDYAIEELPVLNDGKYYIMIAYQFRKNVNGRNVRVICSESFNVNSWDFFMCSEYDKNNNYQNNKSTYSSLYYSGSAKVLVNVPKNDSSAGFIKHNNKIYNFLLVTNDFCFLGITSEALSKTSSISYFNSFGGSEKVINYVYDDTSPTISLPAPNQNGYYTNKVNISVTDSNLDYIYINNKIPCTSSSVNLDITSNLNQGRNTISAYDKAGNSDYRDIIYDTVVPSLTFYATNGTVVSDSSKKYYFKENDNLKISAVDTYVKSISINGSVINNSSGQGSVLWNYPINTTNIPSIKEGENTITVIDNVGLATSLKFWYDSTPPEAIITTANGDKISWGQNLNQYVSFNPTDSSSGLASAIIYSTSDSTISYDWSSFATDRKLYYYTEDGTSTNNLFTTENAAKQYVLSKRKETISVPDGGYKKEFDNALIKEDLAYATIGCSCYQYINKNGATVFSIRYDTIISYIEKDYENWIDFFIGTKKLFDHEGEWKLTLVDNVGNSKDYTFSIDITNPILTIKKGNSIIKEGTFFKQNDTLFISALDTNFSNVKINGETGSVTNGGSFELNGQTWLKYGENIITVYDTHGNASNFTFYYDNLLPTLSAFKNGTSSNGHYKHGDNIKITIKDDYVESVNINGTIVIQSAGILSFILSNQQWLVEGTNTVSCIDRAGNFCSFTFIFDKTAPVGTLSGVTNGGRTNSNVTFNWSDTTAIATLNGTTYSKNTTISAEKAHTIILTDRAGNSTSYTFTIDKTAPVGTLSGVINEGRTNGNVTFSWTENGCAATLNGSSYIKSATIEKEGDYLLVLTDDVGNSTTYSFTIDKTAPTLNISGATNGQTINGDVTLSWTEKSAVLTINDSTPSGIISGSTYSYVVSVELNNSASFNVVLTDRAGNSTSYTFTIDKVRPLIEMIKENSNTSLAWGQVSNQPVTFTATDASGIALVIIKDKKTNTVYDWSSFTANTTLFYYGPEGIGTSNLFSSKEKSKNYVIQQRITSVPEQPLKGYEAPMDDKLCPLDKGYAVVGGDYYSYQNASGNTVYFIRSSSLYTYIENDYENWIKSFISNKILFSYEGNFEITATDAAGNIISHNFGIDTIAPTGSLNGVDNGGITKNNVTFSWIENGASAVLDGNNYIKGAAIVGEGSHIIRLRDEIGNYTIYTFTIDKTAPVGTLSGVTNGGRTNGNVTFSWTENEITVTLDAVPYVKNASVVIDGYHTFVLTDTAGNSTTYSFTIDTSTPTGTLAGVENGGKTKTDVSFSWDDSSWNATIDGNNYIKAASISSEGAHTIILTNDVGSKNTYTFTIDKTAPIGTLSGVTNGGITKSEVKFSWTENGCAATLNGSSYIKSATIEKEGDYLLVLTDDVGNSTTYAFTIRTTAPMPLFSVAATTIVGNTYYYNKNVSVSWNNSDVTATINESSYEKSTVISAEGNYTVVLTDAPGNKTTIIIVMDKTAYVANYNKYKTDHLNHNNHWYDTFVYQLSDNKYIRKSYWSFTNNTDAMSYATRREQGIVERYDSFSIGTTPYCVWAARAVDGFDVSDQTSINGYPYAIYYDKENSNKLIAYFKEENLQAAIIKYAALSISEKYIPSAPAPAYIGDDTVPAQSLYRDYIFIKGDTASFYYKPSDVTLTINGVAKNYTDGLTLGFNNIQEIDRAGNVISYVIILDNVAPVVKIKDFSGNTLESAQSQFVSQTTIYIAQQFRLKLEDEYDNQSLLSIIFGDKTTNIINGHYDFTESGTYTVKTRDIAGNNNTYTVYVSLTQPTISINENLSTQSVLIGFTTTVNKVLDINTLMSINVFTWNTVTKSWVSIAADDNGASISVATLSYYFATTNKYKISVLDSYGRESVCEYNFIKDAPTGRVLTSGGIQLQSGAETQLSVKFVWEDSTSLAYLNDLEYTKGVLISDEGSYTIKLVATGGEITLYNFKIDRTAPIGTLSGINANGFSNSSVSMTWSAESETNTIGYIKTSADTEFYPYVKGTIVSTDNVYSIKLVDKAGNSKIYGFEIKKTPPLVKIITASGEEIKNASLTNQTVSFSWTENGCAAVVKNSLTNVETSYSKNTNLNESATYSLYITDKYGNLAYYSVTIDKTAPNIITNGLTNGTIFTNKTVSFSWTENNIVVKLNETIYVKDTIVENEGLYSLIATDAAGNYTALSFTIDKTAPTGSFSPAGNLVTNILYFKSSTQFNWKESGTTATLNGENYAKGSLIEIAGNNSIILTDAAGNSTTYMCIIDYEAPVATVVGNYNFINDIYYFNTIAALNWEDKTAVATFNGNPYSKMSEITVEGRHSLVVSDRAGNKTTYNIVIDKTPPTLSFSTNYINVAGILYFKSSFSATWTESGLSVELNNDNYLKNGALTVEGNYTFVVSDRAGNRTTYNIVIDKTAPIGSFSTPYLLKAETYYFNKNTSFLWNIQENNSATIDGVTYERDTVITNDGSHIIVLTDAAGNSSEYGIAIDKTAPSGSFNNAGTFYDNIFYFKFSTSFSWSESSLTVTLNNKEYNKGATISAEGNHTIVITDAAGNSTTYSFIIDKTAPIIEPSIIGNYLNNSYYINKGISFKWTDIDVVNSLLDGQNYIINSTVSVEGCHSLVLSDRAGNSTTYSFTIDKTAPVGELSGTFYGPDNYTNNNVRFSWLEDGCAATLDKEKYTKNNYINKEGNHIIVLTDTAGNSTTYSFIISTSVPLGVLTGVIDGGRTNGNVSFSWVEIDYECTLNGAAYIKSSEITAEGDHNIIITGPNMVSKTYTFTIDKTAPIGTLSGVENGGKTKTAVRFSWNESNTCTENNIAYAKNTDISAEGNHTIILTDDVGNSTTYTFTIDKTAPIGTLNGVDNGGRTNGKVSFLWSENGCSADLNGKFYNKNTVVDTEGVFSIVLTDSVGNFNTYTFTIDKTAPIGTLNGVDNGGFTNNNISFEWRGNSNTATLNNKEYIKGTTISAEGNHTIILTDDVGNSTTYSFTIKKIPSAGTLLGVENEGITNQSVSFSWFDEMASAKLGDNVYIANTPITEEGFYTLLLTDAAGNTLSYTFTIDKTAPTGTLVGVTNGGFTNEDVSFSWSELNCFVTINDNIYHKNIIVAAEGIHLIRLTDAAGNSTTYTFTIDKTAPVFSYTNTIVFYEEEINYFVGNIAFSWLEKNCIATLNDLEYVPGTDITTSGAYVFCITDAVGNAKFFNFVIDKTAPIGTLAGVENGGKTKTDVSFSWEHSDTATINGQTYNKNTTVSIEGDYTIILTNKLGTSSSYLFTIDKTAPTGTLAGVTNGGKTNSSVVFEYEFEVDCFAYLKDQPSVYLENKTSFLADGNYTIILSDDVGNSTTYSFTIDTSRPTGTLAGVTNGGKTKTDVSFSWEHSDTATINGQTYNKNTTVSVEGDYTIILTNKLGSLTTYTFTIDKTAPIGTLSGVTDGAFTNTSVYFLWSENGCTAKLNNVEYERDTVILDEGEHIITLTDDVGNSTTYTFTIDKTAPIAEFSTKYEIKEDIYYFASSTVIKWSDKASAVCNNNAITSGSILPKNENLKIVLTDRAGNQSIYNVFIYSKAPTINGQITLSDGRKMDIELQNGKTYNYSNFSISPIEGYNIYLNDVELSEPVNLQEGENNITIINKAGKKSNIIVTIKQLTTENNKNNVVNIVLIVLGLATILSLCIFIIKNSVNKGLKIKRI